MAGAKVQLLRESGDDDALSGPLVVVSIISAPFANWRKEIEMTNPTDNESVYGDRKNLKLIKNQIGPIE